jgi:hypothetical protein
MRTRSTKGTKKNLQKKKFLQGNTIERYLPNKLRVHQVTNQCH